MTNYLKHIMLCKQEHPSCEKCEIEKKLDCKYYQEKNYDQQVKDSETGRNLASFENYRQLRKY